MHFFGCIFKTSGGFPFCFHETKLRYKTNVSKQLKVQFKTHSPQNKLMLRSRKYLSLWVVCVHHRKMSGLTVLTHIYSG